MWFDNLDIFIVLEFYDAVLQNKKITTYDIAKKWYCDSEDIRRKYNGSKNHYYSAKSNTIKARLSKLVGFGFGEIKKKSKASEFVLDTDRVLIRNISFGTKKRNKCLCVKDNKGRWNAFEIKN